jgi:glyoxylase-like metal-dependent hydrolase (beta-lactamase superfamily II)
VVDSRRHTRRQILSAIGGAAGMLLGDPRRSLIAAPIPVRLKPDTAYNSVGLTPDTSAQAASDAAGTLRLSDDLFVITIPGEANVVAQTGANGVVLVDGASARGSDALMKAVAALPGGGPVQTIFNTHWHPEQTGSNERLGKAGTTIIAHENTRLWLTTDVTWTWSGQRFTRLPKVAQPNKTFYTTGSLDSGIRYGYIPDAAHTDGDLYVYFPKQNVLAVGDVVSGQGWPVVDYATGGWIGGMVGGLQRLQSLANDETRIVPGRGPVLGLKDLKAQLQMYGTIYERLTQLLNKGRGPGEAVAAQPTKEFDAQMGNGDEFVRRAFESLWAYLSPDA